jgi:hypothetical protein
MRLVERQRLSLDAGDPREVRYVALIVLLFPLDAGDPREVSVSKILGNLSRSTINTQDVVSFPTL